MSYELKYAMQIAVGVRACEGRVIAMAGKRVFIVEN
jgi:hypothetical protein